MGYSPSTYSSIQYSYRETSMDKGAWQATVNGVAKSQKQLSDDHSLTHSTSVGKCREKRSFMHCL